MEITDFSSLFTALSNTTPKHLVIANGIDSHSIEAAYDAIQYKWVRTTLTGSENKIRNICAQLQIDVQSFSIVDIEDEIEANNRAVSMARNGEADLIMKGLVNTDVFMKAILNKELGLLQKGTLLTHVTVLQIAAYHKLLVIGDVAIIPLPSFDQKQMITKTLVHTAHKIGISNPKVAFIAATEKVIEKMPACKDAAHLKLLWQQGEFGNCVCDGPMGLDVAIDKASAILKGIESPVAGDADCLLFPNIESGNVFYKVNTKFCKAETAAIVVGTKVPTVLSSRGDSIQTKLNSIALAAMLG